jgi:hypothetical protein
VSERVAEAIVALGGAYVAAGALFAIAFAVRGAGRIDAAARGSTTGFRLIILPGAAALWPLLAVKWLRRRS